MRAKQPQAFLLENVRNLKTHDGGRTFRIIRAELQRLGYRVHHQVLDAQGHVPQHRQRIFIVGFHRDCWPDLSFAFPTLPEHGPRIGDILEERVADKYTLSDHLWKYLQDYAAKHRRRGNGFGYGLVDPARDRITRTLSARYHKDGSEILIKQEGRNPRRLTPRECARLMGFPDDFEIPVSDTQAYRQFGTRWSCRWWQTSPAPCWPGRRRLRPWRAGVCNRAFSWLRTDASSTRPDLALAIARAACTMAVRLVSGAT